MSKIACVWVDLADDTDAEAKYEDEHIPSVIEKIGGAARNCDAVEENIFKEVEGIHGKFVTLYELDPAAEDVHARVSPDIKHLPKNTLIETRTYHDDAVYPGEEWRGGKMSSQCFLMHGQLTFTPQNTATSKCSS
jgi:small ligand-binding sensory domain FIST